MSVFFIMFVLTMLQLCVWFMEVSMQVVTELIKSHVVSDVGHSSLSLTCAIFSGCFRQLYSLSNINCFGNYFPAAILFSVRGNSKLHISSEPVVLTASSPQL